MKYLYLNYNLGLSDLLEIGKITLVGSSGEKYVNKALFVPGHGWIPCSKALCENFTNDPKHLVLIISEEDDINKPITSDKWVSRTGIIKSFGVEDNHRKHWNVNPKETPNFNSNPNIKVFNRMSARALVISENAVLQFIEGPKKDNSGNLIIEKSFVCGTKKGYLSPAARAIIDTGTIDDFFYAEVSIDGQTPIPCILRNHKNTIK